MARFGEAAVFGSKALVVCAKIMSHTALIAVARFGDKASFVFFFLFFRSSLLLFSHLLFPSPSLLLDVTQIRGHSTGSSAPCPL